MQVISFATNTNLQHYNGESTLSYLSQMTAVQFLQFTSAASGICVAVAFVRGFKSGAKDLGNFYVDFVRSLTRILFPLCFVASLIFVWLGVPQTLGGYTIVKTVEGATQSILVGPVASLVSIMQLGTNGGGYYGANSAYPFQNPNPASDVLQIILMLLMPTVMCFVYGEILGKRKETRPILWGSYGLFAIDLAIAFIPNPGLGPGMEVRFGGFFSAFWTVVTTAVTTGSVNASLYGMHPLVILAGFMGMLIQATPGGKGCGIDVHGHVRYHHSIHRRAHVRQDSGILGDENQRTRRFTCNDRLLGSSNYHPHSNGTRLRNGSRERNRSWRELTGFTQILYEFTSAAANNGSDFLGASANTPFFNISTGLVMFAGRFAPILLLLALAGSMIGRKRHA